MRHILISFPLVKWKDGKIEKMGTMRLVVAVFDRRGGLGRGRRSVSVGSVYLNPRLVESISR